MLKCLKNNIMAILKYVPPTKKIIDNRNPEGGYYEAKCEICNTLFYPQRSNAKYCTPNCGLIAHRQAVANGTAQRKIVKKPIYLENITDLYTVVGYSNVINWFSTRKIKTHGLLTRLKDLEIKKTIIWNNHKITQMTRSKYEIKI